MSLAVLPGPVTIFVNIKIVTRNSIFCLSYTQLGMADSCLKICLGTNEWFCHVWYKSVGSSSLPLADIFFSHRKHMCINMPDDMCRALLMMETVCMGISKEVLNLWYLVTSVALIIGISRASFEGWCGGAFKWTIKWNRQTAERHGKHIVISKCIWESYISIMCFEGWLLSGKYKCIKEETDVYLQGSVVTVSLLSTMSFWNLCYMRTLQKK